MKTEIGATRCKCNLGQSAITIRASTDITSHNSAVIHSVEPRASRGQTLPAGGEQPLEFPPLGLRHQLSADAREFRASSYAIGRSWGSTSAECVTLLCNLDRIRKMTKERKFRH